MIRTRYLTRRATAAAATGAAAIILAACGGSGDSSTGHDGHTGGSPSASTSTSSSQKQHNAADVAFAQGMIPHHRQAVEMADLAPGRVQSAEVKKLAADIKKAQAPEIRTLSGWLTAWGEQVPAEGTDHSMHDSSGMMTSGDMRKLKKASGAAFDTAFMQMMIGHHEGAVSMARTEQADGSYAPAKKMAGRIVSSQTTEIQQMNELLGNR
ncbi:DUF305 domain-containing protein [Streptomyces sp. BV286]|uniref:DUF305 domain-containing protein n=1 Tax=unclassified Streptomyces TaxID=2593676 RepID=UPI001C2ECE64|nr:DUF305 domain-containing protein [Streptomyces sp. BV286]MBV1941125.1 DUF305 domain-containing protein [Streptomyces sp. BV286]